LSCSFSLETIRSKEERFVSLRKAHLRRQPVAAADDDDGGAARKVAIVGANWFISDSTARDDMEGKE
jgi:hypothetical protein